MTVELSRNQGAHYMGYTVPCLLLSFSVVLKCITLNSYFMLNSATILCATGRLPIDLN